VRFVADQFDVFPSHGSKDSAVVRAIADRLRADGLRVWFAEAGALARAGSVHVGERFRRGVAAFGCRTRLAGAERSLRQREDRGLEPRWPRHYAAEVGHSNLTAAGAQAFRELPDRGGFQGAGEWAVFSRPVARGGAEERLAARMPAISEILI